MKKPLLIAFAVIALVLVIIALSLSSTYNGLVAGEESVKAQWSQVQNVYQRRADLIPNLVATVKGAANFEQTTLQALVDARSKVGGTIEIDPALLRDEESMKRFAQVQSSLGGALQRLLSVTENYPELRSTQQFQDLMVQLEGSENRISVERGRYNQAVRDFNIRIRQFPTNLLASAFGFQPYAPFVADVGADKAPQVQF